MDLKYAFTAQAANITQDGRLNALGIIEVVSAPQFPFVIPHLALVICFGVKPADAGEKRKIGVKLITSDGNALFKMEGVIGFPMPLPKVVSPASQIMDINGLPIPAEGTYEFDVTIEGHTVGTIPLIVVKAT